MKFPKINLFIAMFFLFITPSFLLAQFAGGSGTVEDPYLVETPDHLNNVRNYLSSHFRQIADIDLDVAPYNEGEGWEPIGEYTGYHFSSVYDGDGYRIGNLYINRPSESYVGLFSWTTGYTQIRNLYLDNTNVTGCDFTGALVGLNSSGFIAKCSSKGVVSGNNYVGGLVGENNSGMLSNSFSTCNVIGNVKIGGLIGSNYSGTVMNCYSTGNVDGTNFTGGLIGCFSNIATNSYWDMDASEQTISAGGEGRTTEEMTYPYRENTFVNWDFNSTWVEDEDYINFGYPYLDVEIREFAGGRGTIDDPYLVETPEHLDNVRNYVGAHFQQIADIDLGIAPYNEGEGWEPIGHVNSENTFYCEYDGGGYEIHDLYINRPNDYCIGLFGNIGVYNTSCNISNLNLVNANITGGYDVGALAGYFSNGTVLNCSSSGSILGNENVGGIIGANEAEISNSYNSSSVSGEETIGGLAGYNRSFITNNHNTGNISGNEQIGGLVGLNEYGKLSSCYNTGNITGINLYGGLIGWNRGTIHNSYYNCDQVSINGEYDFLTIGALNNQMYEEWINNGYEFNIHEYLEVENDTFLITSIHDFRLLNVFGVYDEYCYKLVNDIDFCDHPNLFVRYLTGSFDGQGYTISNLNINIPQLNKLGLFGQVYGSSIMTNIILENVSISGSDNVGGLIGYSSAGGRITNCSTSGVVHGDNYVGGLIGKNGGYDIENCIVYGEVEGEGTVGGIIGDNDNGIVKNCANNSVVTGSNVVGGIVGYSNSSYDNLISNCSNRGNVTGANGVGGVAGCNNRLIEYCHNTGNVTGIDHVGGLVGSNGYPIKCCYNIGEITGLNSVGGIVGQNINCNLYNNYNKGRVMGDVSVAGLVANAEYCGMSNSYNVGRVQGGSWTGGLVASGMYFDVHGSYWDIITSLQNTSDGGEGRTTEEMTYPYAENTFAGWDFENVWVEDINGINNGYPYLQGVPLVTGINESASISQKQSTSLTNSPNPFNPTTTIEFSLNKHSTVNLSIYNIKGQLVNTLVDNEQYDIGSHSIVWDGKDSSGIDAASGVYFYRLESGDEVITRKMILMK